MRAGKLDRLITLQGVTHTVDAYGTPVETWADFAPPVRAQVVQSSTDEFLQAYGETDSFAVVFRIRWLAGVTPDLRVSYEGKTLNIREIKEIGRCKGLELRCEEVRT
ncbi:MAG: head-tail adaptor protein [Stappia sp.]|uniref:phage head closure protein n=1 Tax=Stappia sp. TaxID=1870903 RepID=UPI000C4DE833|nr:phage head closure protein [Stappia sp.]MAA98671.1 head-tail adaptor protein [Stappia sp.]MBM20499.1 head-tail adaptor protein [Stappia sp.]|tara:strand:- start:4071 stop:4391 length:321 start_codon:yes stop_codon:yes gene_type:complete